MAAHAWATHGGTAAAPAGGRLSDRFGQRVVAVPGALLFGAGALLLALRIGLHPAYVTEFLPANMLGGFGAGLVFAGFSSAAVAELPPTATRPAARSGCIRQIGAVLGIST